MVTLKLDKNGNKKVCKMIALGAVNAEGPCDIEVAMRIKCGSCHKSHDVVIGVDIPKRVEPIVSAEIMGLVVDREFEEIVKRRPGRPRVNDGVKA